MPETDAEKKKEGGGESESTSPVGEKGVWAEDIRERRYYYDDAHGYEEYDPGDDVDDEE
jgi:hypothetical protein